MRRRSVIIDQDTLGPAGTNLQSVALLLNAPDVDVLGICVCTGDHWRDHQVRQALRLLELRKRGLRGLKRLRHLLGYLRATRPQRPA